MRTVGWGYNVVQLLLLWGNNGSSGPRSKYIHCGHNTQRSFDPPPPPTKGVPRCRGGGGGAQNPKNHWGIIFYPKIIILQGVRHQKPYLGVCYANDPQKGGYAMPSPVLDLTTSKGGKGKG